MTAIGSSGDTDEAGPGGAGGQAGGDNNSEGGGDGEVGGGAGGAWLSRNSSISGDASEQGTVRFVEGS